MTINKKIAGILGMDVPEEDDMECREVIPVAPHEIVSVDNPDLPPMHDVDRKQLQAEKQLEEIIEFSLGYQKRMFAEVDSVEPKFRSRYVEVANATLGLALDAVKVKITTQENRRKDRLKEAEFQRPGQRKEASMTNNFFFGNREELINALENTLVVTVDAVDEDEKS